MIALDPRNPGAIERFLADLTREAAETANQRWLRDNSAAIHRAHAEMMAERDTYTQEKAV